MLREKNDLQGNPLLHEVECTPEKYCLKTKIAAFLLHFANHIREALLAGGAETLVISPVTFRVFGEVDAKVYLLMLSKIERLKAVENARASGVLEQCIRDMRVQRMADVCCRESASSRLSITSNLDTLFSLIPSAVQLENITVEHKTEFSF